LSCTRETRRAFATVEVERTNRAWM
jgi:hypothetical protein